MVNITATAMAFIEQKNSSTILPANIVLTANPVSIAGTITYQWKVNGVTQSETSDTFTLASFSGNPKIVSVTATSGSFEASDEMSIYSLREGDDGLAAGLLNQNQTISCDSDGEPIAGQLPISTTFYAVRGAEVLNGTGSVVFSLVSSEGLTATINSSTGVVNVTALTSLDAYALFRATIGTTQLDSRLTLNKSLNGYTPVKGVDYFDGVAGTSIKVQYSDNNISWHDSPLAGDLYIRTGTKAGTATDYTWAAGVKFVPEKGVEYEDGLPGVSPYLHIKYSNDNGSSFTANNGETAGEYIGTYTDTNAADSSSPSAYTWAKIKGEQGVQGIQGPQGIKGDKGDAGSGTSGASTHRAYIATANSTTAPAWTAGTTTQSGAAPAGWSLTPVTLSAGQAQWQVDGTTPAGSTTTTWSTPYPSYFKVDTLEAVTTNTGNLTVTGTIKVGSTASTTNGILISPDSISIYNAGVLRVKLGSI
jgi:hypothetical protein